MIRSRRGLAALSVGAVLAAAAAISIVLPALREPAERAPDFSLTDQDGHPFRLSAERGHPIVLFFGYAHCADECPVTMAHLTAVLRGAGREQTTRVVMITVDPERDTPAALHRYTGFYDPRPIGLTGSREQLRPVYEAYHVWTQRQAPERGERGYSIAHGTALYFIDSDGRLRGLADWNETGVRLARDFATYLS